MIHSEENIPANKDVLQEITPRQFDELDKVRGDFSKAMVDANFMQAIEIAEIEQNLNPRKVSETLYAERRGIRLPSGTLVAKSTTRLTSKVQGDFADDFFLILGGSVQKVVESGDGEKPGIPVGNPLYHGQYFGQNVRGLVLLIYES
eukprot:767000-Hanusia_phi.AAC.1